MVEINDMRMMTKKRESQSDSLLVNTCVIRNMEYGDILNH
ncbi:hypothetical protein Sps_02464 [Shewanella psychrophila]|uniref:Uncharacterized protein n=1 Tax=Shewanella psychrophila TaxID=225848 RepID=A0A1S6HQ44_9GAMM|nr:hypothetical protein Sps_02464 [Shewanella psychrophila]